MAKIVGEELWKHPGFPGMIVVSTNSTIKANGTLVMGRGAARQARDRIPGIDHECSRMIKRATRTVWAHPPPHGEMALEAYYQECEMEDQDSYSGTGYYFQVVREPNRYRVGFGIFQVKEHFRQEASLELIRRSASVLADYARQHPDMAIRMNYPGIGYGGLTKQKVKPLLERLPDNITICWR